MTAPAWGPVPAWHGHADRHRFALVLCRRDGIEPALAGLEQALAGLGAYRELGNTPNAIELLLECPADVAWALWQQLRETLSDTDVFVRSAETAPIRLLICDMDMTIVAAETLDEVAAKLGMGERIAAITARAMHGELDFDAALRERIAMLAGQPEQLFHDVAGVLAMNPGAEALVAGARAAGVHTILISGGFSQVAETVAQRLGFDEVHCNRLEVEQDRLSGRVIDPIVNARVKRDTLERRARELGIELEACCAIGDGANDKPMIEAAGLGIAYRGKPVLRAATNCQLNFADLDAALSFMQLPQPD